MEQLNTFMVPKYFIEASKNLKQIDLQYIYIKVKNKQEQCARGSQLQTDTFL